MAKRTMCRQGAPSVIRFVCCILFTLSPLSYLESVCESVPQAYSSLRLREAPVATDMIPVDAGVRQGNRRAGQRRRDVAGVMHCHSGIDQPPFYTTRQHAQHGLYRYILLPFPTHWRSYSFEATCR